jgi:DNA mismatch repair protein MutS
MGGLERMNRLQLYSDAQYMQLDASTRRNLELTETMRGKEKRGSLLGVLDRTRTAMGKRLIRSWIEQPLVNPTHILRRHNAVEELLGDVILRGDLREMLADIHDIERIMTRVVYGSVNARELRSLSQTILHIAPMKARMSNVYTALLEQNAAAIDELTDVTGLIERAIADEPPLTVREGGMIREGYNAELDELHLDMSDSKGVLARIEAAEKERNDEHSRRTEVYTFDCNSSEKISESKNYENRKH